MTAEQKELYNFTTNCSPFNEQCAKINKNMSCMPMVVRQLVKSAIEEYSKRYGNGNGYEIFSSEDFRVVSNRIILEVKNENFNS